jgi:hypothetical protein
MGDSGIVTTISVLALLLVIAAVAAFVVAWRVRSRALRAMIGVLLLASAFACGVLSALAAMSVAALGVGALVLAARRVEEPHPGQRTEAEPE